MTVTVFFFNAAYLTGRKFFADVNKIHQNYYKFRDFTQNMKFLLKNTKINGQRTFRRPDEDSVWTRSEIYR